MNEDPLSRFRELARRATEHAQPRNRDFLSRMLAGQQRRQIETIPVRGPDRGPDHGTVVFFADRRPVLRAKYQVVGRLIVGEQVWRWAWADPQVDAALAADARILRAHGEKEGIAALTTPELKSMDFDPAALTAIGLLLAAGEAQWLWPAATGVFEFVVLHDVGAIAQATA